MKNKTTFFTLTLAATLLIAGAANGQGRKEMSRFELKRMDSLEVASVIHGNKQKAKDEKRMSEAKRYTAHTKAKAKHARMIEKEANDAVRESRYARRSEARAHKARKQSDHQTRIAIKTRNKSDKNMKSAGLVTAQPNDSSKVN